MPLVLQEIDRTVRARFYDANLNGADWAGAVARASEELAKAGSAAERDAVYDRLLATLSDSHSFRLPGGRLPERDWGTAGFRLGREGEGYAVKGVIPGSAAARAGMRLGDRVLEIDGRPYGAERVDFRELFFALEGKPGDAITVKWKRAGAADETARTDRLVMDLEPSGDSLVWSSARVIRRGGRTFGYAHLWGMSAETALAIVDLLLDRAEIARARPALAGWENIEGFVLDVRGNSGGYDPNILPTFLRGMWNASDYYVISREGKRLSPPAYAPLPVALVVNSGTASAGEALALKFRAHAIGPIVGEPTAGMASAGAAAQRLSDGSTLWLSVRAIESKEGQRYEGKGVPPDVSVPDEPGTTPGDEDTAVEAALKALLERKP